MYLEDFFSKDNKIVNLINSNLDWDIWDNEKIIKSTSTYMLASWENLKFSFSWIVDFTWSIQIKEWWPLFFEVISYSWADYSKESVLSSSWLISDNLNKLFTWYLTSAYDRADINLKNLWWFSSFSLDLNKTPMWTWTTKKYRITKTIWWKEVEKSIIEN